MRSRATKARDEKTGPKMADCPYCEKRVSNRKTLAWSGGRICRSHFCNICGLPVRPEQAITSTADGEIVTRCKRHKCSLCGQRTETVTAIINGSNVICGKHRCAICGVIVSVDSSVVIDGKTVCRTHNHPAKSDSRKGS